MSSSRMIRPRAGGAALLLAAVGCGTSMAAGEGGAGAAAGGGAGASGGAGGFTVLGSVLDLDGAPVVDMFVTVSTEFCIPDRTDAAGAFSVGQVTVGPKRFISYGETAAGGQVASLVFAFEADDGFSFPAPIRDPVFQETWPIDPQAATAELVSSGAGLELSIPAGSLELAPFAPAEVQIARVPLEQAPPMVPAGVTLIDLFALGPIRSTFDPPAAVVFPSQSALPAGTAVAFYQLDYDTGQMKPVAGGIVDVQGRPETSPGQGLGELTWVGVAAE